MGSEVLQIKTNEKKFFLQYLMLKKPILDIYVRNITGSSDQMPAKLIHVLAMLLYYNHLYSDVEEEERWNKIFNSRHRKMICEDLGMKNQQLNTYYSTLRGYKMIINNRVNSVFVVKPEKDFELTFKFSINGEK